MNIIDADTTAKLSAAAEVSPRKRANICLHRGPEDVCQRMICALEPGTYAQPHKHENPDKDELIIILKGKAAMIEFDDNGNPSHHVILDAEGNFLAAEIPPRIFHTIICLEKGTICAEIKQGPYSAANEKIFAPWAPAEGEPGTAEYNERLLKMIL
jgi:cupin fold WbuC family metalloprotein